LIHKNNVELCDSTPLSEKDRTLTLTESEIEVIFNSIVNPIYGELGLAQIIRDSVIDLPTSERDGWHFIPMSKLVAGTTSLDPNYSTNGFCRDRKGVSGPWFRLCF